MVLNSSTSSYASKGSNQSFGLGLSVNCGTSSTYRSYYVYVKVTGTGSTTPKTALSLVTNGYYC